MPTPDPGLSARAGGVRPLLSAIATGSGLAPDRMRAELVQRLPEINPATLKRNWNRWLAGPDNGGALPTLRVLMQIVGAARNMGWLDGRLPGEARSLERWLAGREIAERREARHTAARALNAFVDELLRDVDFQEYDVAAALEELFATFCAGVAHHIERCSTPGGAGLAEGVRDGTVKALQVVEATLSELADDLEENDEFAPVADDGDAVKAEDVAVEPSDDRTDEEPNKDVKGRFFGRKL